MLFGASDPASPQEGNRTLYLSERMALAFNTTNFTQFNAINYFNNAKSQVVLTL